MWSSPTSLPVLEDQTIHLWRMDLDPSPGITMALRSVLSADEKEKARKFKFLRDAQHYITARGYLRYLLGQYLECPPERIEFTYTEYGKPMLAAEQKLAFNVSHSSGKALMGFVQNGVLGVDLEAMDRSVDIPLLARHSFSPSEQQALFSLPPVQQKMAFFRCWTRKESFIKARGDGLSLPLDQFEVSLLPQAAPELKATYWDPDEPQHWMLREVVPYAEFVGAWACRAEKDNFQYFDMNPPLFMKWKAQ